MWMLFYPLPFILNWNKREKFFLFELDVVIGVFFYRGKEKFQPAITTLPHTGHGKLEIGIKWK